MWIGQKFAFFIYGTPFFYQRWQKIVIKIPRPKCIVFFTLSLSHRYFMHSKWHHWILQEISSKPICFLSQYFVLASFKWTICTLILLVIGGSVYFLYKKESFWVWIQGPKKGLNKVIWYTYINWKSNLF